jgi:glycosyltransferase involved in cell wall biosynthesis
VGAVGSADISGTQRFLWHWPFARPEELDWARSTIRPGEHITVQVIDRASAPPAVSERGLHVVRNLPEVRPGVTWWQRPTSRAHTYVERARRRSQEWRGGSFDLLHIHYVNRFVDSWWRLPHPLVLSVHDVTPHVSRLGTAIEGQLLLRLYRRADALVVHHQRLADRLQRQFDIDTTRVFVVPHQVFPTGLEFTMPPERELPQVLFFGTLRQNKGIDVLLSTVSQLSDAGIRFVIAGRGDPALEERVRAAAAQSPHVRTELGYVPLERKHQLFREANVVVLPYTSFASQSGVLHDAYGHGRPVVVTDVGALGDTVREDRTGVVVGPSDAAGLATGIATALRPEVWAPASEASRAIAASRSPAATGLALRSVYDVVLGPQ